MKISLYDIKGTKQGDVSVDQEIFGAKVNADLMHRSIVMRLANKRRPIAHVLNRGEVAYSTKKLFRQKGTGRARRGARSTNLLRGGGAIHAPRNDRNFSKAMPKKERRRALFSALSSKMNEKSIFALKSYQADKPQTKAFVDFLKKAPEGKRYLLVLDQAQEVIEKSARNIPGVRIVKAAYLHPYDILWADQICFYEPAITKTTETFLS